MMTRDQFFFIVAALLVGLAFWSLVGWLVGQYLRAIGWWP